METNELSNQQESSENKISCVNSSDTQSLSKEIERLCLERDIKKKNEVKSNNKGSDEKDLLWHYCSNDTFLEILKHQTIRLSDITKSNDYMELMYVLNPLKSMVEERNSWPAMLGSSIGTLVGGLIGAWIEKPENKDEYWKNLLSNDAKNKADNKALQEHLARFTEKIDGCVWGFCLTENEDDLNMWRGYGNNTSGIAIGFKKSELKNMCDRYKTSNFGEIVLSGVNYGKNKAKSTALEMFDRLFGKTQDLRGLDEEEQNNALSEIFADLGVTLATCKDSGFKSEREVRIILSSVNMEKFDGLKVDYRIKNNKIVSYIDIAININEAIQTVYVGPKNDNSVADIERILKHYHCEKIEVAKSTIPYM